MKSLTQIKQTIKTRINLLKPKSKKQFSTTNKTTQQLTSSFLSIYEKEKINIYKNLANKMKFKEIVDLYSIDNTIDIEKEGKIQIDDVYKDYLNEKSMKILDEYQSKFNSILSQVNHRISTLDGKYKSYLDSEEEALKSNIELLKSVGKHIKIIKNDNSIMKFTEESEVFLLRKFEFIKIIIEISLCKSKSEFDNFIVNNVDRIRTIHNRYVLEYNKIENSEEKSEKSEKSDDSSKENSNKTNSQEDHMNKSNFLSKLRKFYLAISLIILIKIAYGLINPTHKFLDFSNLTLTHRENNLSFDYYDTFDDSNSNKKHLKDQKNQSGKSILSKFDITNTSKLELTLAKNIKERLSDVKGIREVKEEIDELIKMIKNPNDYTSIGAKLHKGILLCGKPGTGKTLLARAISGESNINFLFVTGSDFDETFVGVGSKRIRELFKKARENKPCIIFIDEIDSLLDKSRRGSYEHSSSRSTLNQFLSEMDGFKSTEEIYLIGATNHEKSLDPAAIRPGRFDKIIHIGVPDIEGREEIIDYYLQRIRLKKSCLTSKTISLMTPGFTGAEIQNLINLSIISAVNNKKDEVELSDISESRDRVLMGIARKNYSVPEKRRYKTALHEAGHALVCYKDEVCRKTLHKLTVVPRGQAEGVTFRLVNENALNTKQEYLTDIDIFMGGQVAEELIYGPGGISAGCSNDLENATSLARSMIKNFGMYGSTVGYQYIDNQSYSFEEDEVSEKHKKAIDDEVTRILNESHGRVYKMLLNNADELKSLAQQCYIHDTLEFDDIQNSIEGRISLIKASKVREGYVEKVKENI